MHTKSDIRYDLLRPEFDHFGPHPDCVCRVTADRGEVLRIRSISCQGNLNRIIGEFGGQVRLRNAFNHLHSLLYTA